MNKSLHPFNLTKDAKFRVPKHFGLVLSSDFDLVEFASKLFVGYPQGCGFLRHYKSVFVMIYFQHLYLESLPYKLLRGGQKVVCKLDLGNNTSYTHKVYKYSTLAVLSAYDLDFLFVLL